LLRFRTDKGISLIELNRHPGVRGLAPKHCGAKGNRERELSCRIKQSLPSLQRQSLASHVYRLTPWRGAVAVAASTMQAAFTMLAASIMAEPMCAVAWPWALVPLPSAVPSTTANADITAIRVVIEFVC
jgi:hypothetical protein